MADKKNADGWVSAKPNFIKLGGGEGEISELTGVYVSRDWVEIEGKPVPRYTFRGEDNKLVSFLGTVQIAQALDNVPKGSEVKITYTGEDGKGARRFKTFDIFERPGPPIEAPEKLAVQGDLPF